LHESFCHDDRAFLAPNATAFKFITKRLKSSLPRRWIKNVLSYACRSSAGRFEISNFPRTGLRDSFTYPPHRTSGDYSLKLEGETHPEFDLPRSTERVDAGTDSHAVHILPSVCGAVDLSCAPSQQSVECSPWQIKVRKIEEFVEADARSNGQSFSDPVRPIDFRVEGTQPEQVDFPLVVRAARAAPPLSTAAT
jgi:hypothetical protein